MNIMTGWFQRLAAILLLVAVSSTQLLAQGTSAVVVSIASVDEMMADVTYATEAAGVPQFAGLVQFMSAQYIQSFDRKKPAGVLINFDAQSIEPNVVAFLPVTNMQQLLNLAAQQLGPAEDVGGGVKQLNGPQPIFLKEANGFAFVSNASENLGNVPADPVAQLNGMDQKYNIAVAVNMRAVPESLRQMAVENLKAGFEAQLESLPEEQRAAQEQLTRNSLDQMTKFFEQGETVSMGWAIDKATKSTYFDINVTAVAGSELAGQIARMSNLKTNFAGFDLPNAAGMMSFTSVIEEADKAQAQNAIAALKKQAMDQLENDADLPSEEARTAAKGVLDNLMGILDATVAEGVIDGGAVLTLDGGTVKFAAGMQVADGAAAQKALEELLELAADDPEVPEVKLNAAQHGDVSFHTMSVPIPDEDAQKAFGETLEVALGTGTKSVYIALGQGGVDLVKQVIDKSKQAANAPTVPAKLVVSLGPILKFSQQFQEDEPALNGALAALQQAQGMDHILMVGKTIPNGINYRIEVEEGVLRVIGAAVQAQMQGQ